MGAPQKSVVWIEPEEYLALEQKATARLLSFGITLEPAEACDGIA